MNIIKLQNELKNVPDQALIGYVQNPTGQVPSYLALSELQRRKEMREKYQQAQAPESSVAEDLTQSNQGGLAMLAKNPTPQGAPIEPGVAGLPTGDMYQEQNFATGGIVAFAGPEGSYVQSDDPYGDMYLSDLERALAIKQYELDKKKRLQDKTFPGFLSTPPTKSEQYDINSLAAKVGKGGYDSTLESPALTDTEVAIKKAIADANKNPFTDKSLYSGSTVPVEKIGDLKSYADEFKNYIGEDPMRAKLAERMAKIDTSAEQQATQAPWLALAQAGFGIAGGKSPFAIQNIAEGAMGGIKAYSEAKDKLNQLEEKRFNLMADMAKADRAEKIAVAKYGADSKQAAEARAHADRLHNSSIQTQYKIAELNATVNQQNRTIAAKDKLEDNVRAKIKQIHGEGTLSPEEYDKVFKKYLSEAYAQYGLTGAPAVTESMPGNMVFDPKTKEYTYKPKS